MAGQANKIRIIEALKIFSGILVLGVMLWETFSEYRSLDEVNLQLFRENIHLILFFLVSFNTLCVLTLVIERIVRRQLPNRSLCVQMIVGLLSIFVFSGGVWGFLPRQFYLVSLLLACMPGVFSFISLSDILKENRRSLQQGRRVLPGSPATIFLTAIFIAVTVSTTLLITPGSAAKPISFADAIFTSASAISITGLTSIDISSTLTPLGKLVVLADFQVGAMGVMTFIYYILLMLGRRLNMEDSSTLSSILDEEKAFEIPRLLLTIVGVSLLVELIGAVMLYITWQGNPAVPQDLLWFYAIFHSVSAFCNAGITLFPQGLEQPGIVNNFGGQAIMLTLILAGTLGFGVYLEGITRLRKWCKKKVNHCRWSTHSWLVIRVNLIVLIVGVVGLALLCLLDHAEHAHNIGFNVLWESLWNTIGRSAGFNLSDLSEYGPVYHIYMCMLMFVGGNPAGTGGGVFAPVVAICAMEIVRVLSGRQDLELHQRRIARHTVERAMATVILSILFIIVSTVILLLIERLFGEGDVDVMSMLFLEVSAYTTTGYTIISPAELTVASKLFISLNMVFGRMGMFACMLLFIKHQPPQAFRYPETRLPLN